MNQLVKPVAQRELNTDCIEYFYRNETSRAHPYIGKSLKAVPQAKTCQRIGFPTGADEKKAQAYNTV